MDNKRIRLDDLKKEVPFTVPEGYFDKLPQMIQARIPSEPVRKPVIGWSWQRSLALVSAMALILVLVWVTVPERQGSLGQEPLSGISNASIVSYLEDQDMSYYDLSEHKVVQKAFDTDSTVLFYLDGLEDDILRQQLQESVSSAEAI
ncbi:ash family protein [Dyadobacter fanqingshengii]|uniref:Ash family protein n=1 Tax=Dyadobacter fanqingshengii TaxID=2906443 RepID=A0A9X1PEX6_9BACT|nr:ash family protein [Dyadobacter fanqingshengii]MCF0043162.1 ash family protein [Dyadobacter fanqingshengii]MCF0043240.1 ash family protein [Dyadobacter fanqingshengii]MCF2506744.1 ash family protein [Dyadobacter fanqingshengii]USJ35715.1 ash family protein [Dyadobacter fanqingshengii]